MGANESAPGVTPVVAGGGPAVVGAAPERMRAKTLSRSNAFHPAAFDGSPPSEPGVAVVERSSSNSNSCNSAALDFSNSASSDDEVQALVGGAGQEDSPLPLEFCTSPPEGAHRPTRSLSPPPKLFLADDPHHHHHSMTTTTTVVHLHQPRESVALLTVANGFNRLAAASPRKRHRHGRRPHNIQRPCLDFEKMQQVRLITSLPVRYFAFQIE